MIDFFPLDDAIFASTDDKEIQVLADLRWSIHQGSPYPSRFFGSGDAATVLSDFSLEALRKVLRSTEEDQESPYRKRAFRSSEEDQQSSYRKRVLDFGSVDDDLEKGVESCEKKKSPASTGKSVRSRGRSSKLRKIHGKGVKIVDDGDTCGETFSDATLVEEMDVGIPPKSSKSRMSSA